MNHNAFPVPPQQPAPGPRKRPLLLGCLGCGSLAAFALVAFVGCGAVLSTAGGPASPSEPAPKSEEAPAAEEADSGEAGDAEDEPANTVGVGEAGTVADWTVTVEGTETAATYGPEYLEETAQGEFVIFGLTVANEGDESTFFDSSAVSLRDADGKEYSSQTVIGESDLFLEQINPGNSASGDAVVDVPAGTEITQVVIEDTWSFTAEPLTVELG